MTSLSWIISFCQQKIWNHWESLWTKTYNLVLLRVSHMWHSDVKIRIPSVFGTSNLRVNTNRFCIERNLEMRWLISLTPIQLHSRSLNTYIRALAEFVPLCGRVIGKKQKYAQWYGREWRVLRARAIDAGHRVSNTNDKRCQLEACQKYRACVQKKRREHKDKCLAEIEATYTVDKNNLWKAIDRLSGSKSLATEPSDSEFFNHFNQLSNGQALPTFSVEYEAKALAFFNKYDASNSTNDHSLESMIINDNFTATEVETAIDKS